MKIFKDLRFYLIIALSLVSVYLLQKLTIFAFPKIYYILGGLVVLALVLILVLMVYAKHKALRVIAIVLLLLFTSAFGYASTIVDNVYTAIKQFEENAKQKSKLQYSVIINGTFKDDETVPSLIDYKDGNFAVLEAGNTSYNHEVVEMIRDELGEKLQFESLDSIEEALTRLKDGSLDAIIVNESIRYLIDYDLDEITTPIKTYEFETEKIVEANKAQVTQEAFIVYLTGIDTYGSLDYISRSDVNKIMVVNPLSKDILLVDIPRDYYVPLSCYYNEYDKLTHTGIYGPSCTVETVENFFDIDINYYARVNFSSIIEIIDALGGVDVNNNNDFSIDGYHFPIGVNHLDGKQALAFSRERYSFDEGDQQRVRNQSLVVRGIINKILSPSILNDYENVLDVVSANVETNMPFEDIIALVQMQLKDNAEWKIESYTVVGEEAYAYSAMMGRELYMRLPIDEAVEEAQNLISEYLNRVY